MKGNINLTPSQQILMITQHTQRINNTISPIFMTFYLYPTSNLAVRLVLADLGVLNADTCPTEWDPNEIVMSTSGQVLIQSNGFAFGCGGHNQIIVHRIQDIEAWIKLKVSLLRIRLFHTVTMEVLITTCGLIGEDVHLSTVAESCANINVLINGSEF